MSVKIAIVEDNPEFLEQASLLLEDSPPLEAVGRFVQGQQAIQGIVEKCPEVALIDLALVIRTVSEGGCGTKLVVLTNYDDDESLFSAIQAGAKGYIAKGKICPSQVLRTVEDIAQGRASMSMGLARRILDAFRESPRRDEERMPVKIAIVEDNPEFLEQVSLLLEDSPSLEVVGRFVQGQEAIRGIVEKCPEVALIDLALPDISGVEVIQAVRGCGTKLVVLTTYDDDEHLFSAIQAGAEGYIVKGEMCLAEVLRTVEDIAQGKASMSMGLARRVLDAFREVSRKNGEQRLQEKLGLQKLTDKEREILQYLAKGFYPQKIADILDIKYNTVRLHQKHIYRKLQVNCAIEAVAKVKGLK